jgi:regulator of sigma E protease
MLAPLAFILAIAILVTVHEYGHFQVARWCGVRVLKFSIGFGKPLWVKRFGKDQTEFIVAAIPLGGYVKMLDEREFNQGDAERAMYSNAELNRAFNRQPVLKRMLIVLAGPLANLLLAILLYSMLFMMGVVGLKPILADVVPQSPAALAGFEIGEAVQSVNGRAIASWQDFHWQLLKSSLNHEIVEVRGLNRQQIQKIHSLDLSALRKAQANDDAFAGLGFTPQQVVMPAKIGEVVNGSPADIAGLQIDDLIVTVDKQSVASWQDFVAYVRLHAGQVVAVQILRGDATLSISLKPEAKMEQGVAVGHIGAAVKMQSSGLILQQYSLPQAVMMAIEKTCDTAIFSLQMLIKMLIGQVSWQGVSGPVTIASYAGQSAAMGIKVFIGFLALISISIGVLNLLPIPVLDGGHLMYYMLEILTGKPVPESVMAMGQKIGLTLLGLMMIIAFYNDIFRLITG